MATKSYFQGQKKTQRPLTEQTQRLFYVATCNADKAREAEAARMWQRSFRGASSSFTTKSTFRDRDTNQRNNFFYGLSLLPDLPRCYKRDNPMSLFG